jgi:sugar diacid utilization regulator
VSSAGALAYLEEVQGVWSDQEIVRRDLLELLLAGDDPEAARRHAASLGTDLAEDYAVVVIRAADRPAREATPATLRDRDLLRSTLDAARTWLTRPARPALVGLRHGEVVALCPAADHEEHADIRGRCEALAQADLQTHIAVGLGGHHRGLTGVATSFAEAREAATAAAARPDGAHAVAFDDMMVTHLLRSSPDADRLLGELLRPVLAYDAERGTDLVQTLRTYVQAGFSPTRSAAQLIVHPNTVLYRLRRIRELTGRDPHEPDDLVLLAIALKHLDGH